MNKILLLIGLLFCFSLSYAGLSVDPLVTNIKCKPEFQYKGQFLVKNTYDRDINIIVDVKQGKTFLGNGDIDIKNWLKVEKNKYFIKAGKTLEVPYTANIDKKFKGSVSARLTFTAYTEEKQMITISISVPIYITIEGTENIDFDIDTLNLYTSKDNISYKLVLENKGNVHIRHSGMIEIYSKNKKKLLKTIYLPETVPTYSEKKDIFLKLCYLK